MASDARVLARACHAPIGDGPFMTTLIFQVKKMPAALYKAMGGFATNGVTMTKLESYQRGGTFAATEFHAEVEGKPGDPGLDNALAGLGFHAEWVRVLGTYRQARAPGVVGARRRVAGDAAALTPRTAGNGLVADSRLAAPQPRKQTFVVGVATERK